MNNKEKEILLIAQEECAEVTQAISKIFRFGVESRWPEDGINNRSRLVEEVGDLVAMIKLMGDNNIIDIDEVAKAAERKITKLKTWSSIL